MVFIALIALAGLMRPDTRNRPKTGNLSCGQSLFGDFDRVRTHVLYFLGHLLGNLCESGAFSRGKIEHLNAFPSHANGVQNALGLFHPFAGAEIPIVEAAIAFQTPDDVNSVGAFLERVEHVDNIHFSGAGHADNPNVSRILETHGTCQVRSGVSSEVAAERNDDRLKICHHNTPSSSASTLLRI
jgi:hypothetical protein